MFSVCICLPCNFDILKLVRDIHPRLSSEHASNVEDGACEGGHKNVEDGACEGGHKNVEDGACEGGHKNAKFTY